MTTPQLFRFGVLELDYILTGDGYLITCRTNNPVHLWLRWTTTVPQKHIHARIVRGAQVGTYIDQCFVVYTDVEQEEPGDTLIHTFIVEPWPHCETRWFYLWGTIAGETSPSASAIFKKHRIYTPPGIEEQPLYNSYKILHSRTTTEQGSN